MNIETDKTSRRRAVTPFRAAAGTGTPRWVRCAVLSMAAAVTSVLFVSEARASKPQSFAQPKSLASVGADPFGGVWTHRDPRAGHDAHSAALGGARSALTGSTKAGQELTADQIAQQIGTVVTDPTGDGYYLITENGHLARYSATGKTAAWGRADLDAAGYTGFVIMGAAMTPDGQGMWVLDDWGRVFTLGTAQHYGQAYRTGETPTGIVAHPSGRGYYIVEADGGVHVRRAPGETEQSIPFFGSTGGKKPDGKHVTGIALALNADGTQVEGYWLVNDAGRILRYGNTHGFGDTGGRSTDWITGITALPGQGGYAIVHEDGDAEMFTSAGRTYLNAPGTPAPSSA